MVLGMEPTDIVIFSGILLIFLLLSYGMIHLIIRRKNRKAQLKLKELENQKIKMDMMFKKQLKEDLNEAQLFLTDEEVEHIESLKIDNSILSRKILYKMSEMEEKTKRLDLGVNRARLDNKLKEIGEHEKKVF